MKHFILEIFSEELPPLCQENVALGFKKIIADELLQSQISSDELIIESYVSPKRLALLISNLKVVTIIPEQRRIGPKVSANEKSIKGFLRSNKIEDISQLKKITKKGEKYYVYDIEEQRVKTADLLKIILNKSLNKLPSLWPRLMKWNIENSHNNIQWARPVRNILCMIGNQIIDIEFAGLKSNDYTFYKIYDQKLKIDDAKNYKELLKNKDIIVDHNERRLEIFSQIKTTLLKENLTLIDQEGDKIFKEITGLCENPIILMGSIEESYMKIPDEILTLSLKSNQKYLCLKNIDGNLTSKFLFVAQCDDNSNLKEIIAGNERVVNARLSDASFFINEDLKSSLEDKVPYLANIVFHYKLGSYYDKALRLNNLTKFLAIFIPHCEISLIERLCLLSKADLSTNAVSEFSDLQGKIGSYYALKSAEDDKIVAAIYEHYMPVSQNAELPKTSLGIALSIADKIDNIVGLFLAGEKPSSSRDPFGIRRAVIGIIRIGFFHNIAFPIKILIEKSLKSYPLKLTQHYFKDDDQLIYDDKHDLVHDIVIFFVERLKIYLRENDGLHPEIVNAVIDHYAANVDDHKYCDILFLAKKIRFLDKIIFGEDKLHIISLYKRVSRIVQIEEKKDNVKFSAKPSKIGFKTKYEVILYKRVRQIYSKFTKLIFRSEFDEALQLITILEQPLNDFFDNVVINHEDAKIRENRLQLLSFVRDLFEKIYGLSKIDIP